MGFFRVGFYECMVLIVVFFVLFVLLALVARILGPRQGGRGQGK